MNKLKLLAILIIAMPCMMQASDHKQPNAEQTQATLENNFSIEYGANLLDTVYSQHRHHLNFGEKYNYFKSNIILIGTTKELLRENKTKLLTTAIATIRFLNNLDEVATAFTNDDNEFTKNDIDRMERSFEKTLLDRANGYFALIEKIQTIELNEAKLEQIPTTPAKI